MLKQLKTAGMYLIYFAIAAAIITAPAWGLALLASLTSSDPIKVSVAPGSDQWFKVDRKWSEGGGDILCLTVEKGDEGNPITAMLPGSLIQITFFDENKVQIGQELKGFNAPPGQKVTIKSSMPEDTAHIILSPPNDLLQMAMALSSLTDQ